MASNKKKQRVTGGGFTPFNQLGSRNDTASRPNSSTPSKNAAKRKAELHQSRGSDSMLLLNKRNTAPNEHYGSRKRLDSLSERKRPMTKDIWSEDEDTEKPHLGMYMDKLTQRRTSGFPIKLLRTGAVHDVDDSELFSDEEHNNLPVSRLSILHVSDYESNLNLSKYCKVNVPVEEVTFGRSLASIDTQRGNTITLTLKLEDEQMELTQNTTSMVLPVKEVRKLRFAAGGIHLDLDMTCRWPSFTERVTSLHFKVSQPNTLKFVHLWRAYCNTLGIPDHTEQMTAPDLDRLIRPLQASFANKRMTSLQKQKPNPRSPLLGAAKRIPLQRSLGPNIATSPGIFYSPSPASGSLKDTSLEETPSSRTRLTRSSTRGELTEPITIEDVTPVRTKKKEEALPPFIPSLRYTFKDTSFTITDSDFKCLGNKQWVNDTLIDFFMKYLTAEAVKKGNLDQNDCHAFSTFFFTKLTSSKNHYENIKRWLSRIDLMNKKFAIIPINESLHWYGCIVYNINGLLTEDEKCMVYVFDSLTQKHADVLPPIRQFLVEYFKDKCGLEIDPDRIQYKAGRVWKQPNFNDCGVHVIHNVSVFLEEQKNTLELWSKERVKDDDLRSVFKKDRNNWRKEFREILLGLQEDMMKAEGYVPEHDAQLPDKVEEEDDDEGFVVIEPEEFKLTEKSKSSSKNGSKSGSKSASRSASKEGSAGPDDAQKKNDSGETKSRGRSRSPEHGDDVPVDQITGSVQATNTEAQPGMEKNDIEKGITDTYEQNSDDPMMIDELVSGVEKLGTQSEDDCVKINPSDDEDDDQNVTDTPVPASPDQRGTQASDIGSTMRSRGPTASLSDNEDFFDASMVISQDGPPDTEVLQSDQSGTPFLQVEASQDIDEPTSTTKKCHIDITKDVVEDVSDSSSSDSDNSVNGSTGVRGATPAINSRASVEYVKSVNEKLDVEGFDEWKVKAGSPTINGKKRKQTEMSRTPEGIDLTADEQMSPVKLAKKGSPMANLIAKLRNSVTSSRHDEDSEVMTIHSDKEDEDDDSIEEVKQTKKINREMFEYKPPSGKKSADESITEDDDDDDDVVEVSDGDEPSRSTTSKSDSRIKHTRPMLQSTLSPSTSRSSTPTASASHSSQLSKRQQKRNKKKRK